jgi:large subunit ribosomal protein L1
VAVADEATLKKIEENKIDFTVLLATSAQMPKLIKYAKVLGPKGLMPNPKNGTITEKPEETIKKLAGKTKYKTEEKAAVMHVTIGRVKDKEKALTENLVALLKTVGRSNLVRAVVAPTMGPGVKIDLGKIG